MPAFASCWTAGRGQSRGEGSTPGPVTDERGELITAIRRFACAVASCHTRGHYAAAPCESRRCRLFTPATHVRLTARRTVVWAPELYEFPAWARGADLMFAEAAAWDRPIRFASGVGGHLAS
jgi:hypothetical protein